MKQEFNISGMNCVACSSRIERVINKLEGVNLASVNLMSNYMIVDYDEEKIFVGKAPLSFCK